MRIDLHQHLWTPELSAALARRLRAPLLRPAATGWRLELPYEPPSLLGEAPESVVSRVADSARDELERVIVSLSPALGVEGLPPEEAAELIAAFDAGVDAAGEPFARWASVGLREVDLDAVDRALDTGAIGVCIPSGAVGSPAQLDALGPLLERIDRCGVPLFVHPGPGLRSESGPFTYGPVWWSALTDYVASMQAAWLAWIAGGGRAAHPTLRIVFAMLAGGAPLQVERLAARGEPTVALADDLTFYDTSSYGPLAIDAVAQVVGRHALVYGSDRPVVDAHIPNGPDTEALLVDNPARLFARTRTREAVAR
jgi:hypothetical protein